MPNDPAAAEVQLHSVALPHIAYRFVEEGLINSAEAETLARNARQAGRAFHLEVIAQEIAPSARICELAAAEFGLPFVDLHSFDMDQAPKDLAASDLMERHTLLPLYLDRQNLYVAVKDPANTSGLESVHFNTGLTVRPVLVEPEKLDGLLANLIGTDDGGVSLSEIVNEAGLDETDLLDDPDKDVSAEDLDIDTPIVRLVNKVLHDAIRSRASDIHIEPYERVTRIRFRVDGVLQEAINPPANLTQKIVARLKIMTNLDIAERRIPQDGRMKLRLSRNRDIDFRLSTMPTVFGEKVVIRILDASAANLDIESLGMDETQLALYTEAIARPHGMILVSGPTGSGKTMSLYSALNVLNITQRNISSAEDPVEIYLPGINQVNINEKTGLTFAIVLRAFLRQDPDVLMVGEMRDLETAEIGVKASQTGHLVLSTVHTNDAPSSLIRLVNMGVAPFNIVSSVTLVLAQRLARKLCLHCRKSAQPGTELLQQAGFNEHQLDTMEFYEANEAGCSRCVQGYRGRTGLFEAMPMTDALGEMLLRGTSSIELVAQASSEGVATLRESGLAKVATGVTSLGEIERVTAL